MVCVSTVLFIWIAEKGAAGQSQESLAEIPGNGSPMKALDSSTAKSSDKLQSEQFSAQEAEPTEEPVEEPESVLTAEYELIYEGIRLFDVFDYAAFKDMNTHADLYMRRLQDDTEGYVELSLWSDQKEIWYTINGDPTGDYDWLYWEHSECLTLDQKQCYYVVPLDGTVYLM